MRVKKPTKPCKFCGVEFYHRWNGRIFCSRACFNWWQSKNFRDRRAALPSRDVALSLVDRVCSHMGVTRRQIMGKYRIWTIGRAKCVAELIIRNNLKWSLPQIGELFGVDHCTVMLNIRKAQERIEAGKQPELGCWNALAAIGEPMQSFAQTSEMVGLPHSV